MVDHASQHEVPTIALPKIGCGIGGLRWGDVEQVLSGIVRETDRVQIEVWTG